MHNYIYKKGIKIMIIALIFVLGMSAMIFAVHRRYSQAESDLEHSKEVKETPADDLTKVYEPVAIETAETIEPQTTTVAETILVQETEPFVETKEIVEISTEASSFVSNFKIAETVSQMIVVSADGSRANLTMHEKTESGFWEEILTTKGWVGENGVGTASEYDTKTPAGIFTLSFAFGNKDNPGTTFSYIKADSSHYWVDDVNSKYYNKFVSTNEISPDWNSAEHINSCGTAYNYVLPIDYNTECIPGKGSAMFLHVSTGIPTAGCVTVQESDMVYILSHIRNGCVIVIDTQENIRNY